MIKLSFKQSLALILSLALMLTATVSAFASGTTAALTVKTDAESAKSGDVITVSVDLSANSNLGALTFSLTYNPNEFEYVAGSAKDNGLFGLYSINDEKSGEIIFVGAAVEAVKAAGTLLTAQFKVLKTNSTFGICVSEAADENDVEFAPEVNANSKGATVACKHTAGSSWTVVKEATCTEVGSKKSICIDCGAEVFEEIPMASHSFGDWVVTKDATCTEEGVETRACAACGKNETQPIPAKGHNWSVSEDGTKQTCTVCGAEEILVIPGDVNGDGKITAVDARWALQGAAKKRELSERQIKAADMNGDGKITAVDARQILKKAAGK